MNIQGDLALRDVGAWPFLLTPKAEIRLVLTYYWLRRVSWSIHQRFEFPVDRVFCAWTFQQAVGNLDPQSLALVRNIASGTFYSGEHTCTLQQRICLAIVGPDNDAHRVEACPVTSTICRGKSFQHTSFCSRMDRVTQAHIRICPRSSWMTILALVQSDARAELFTAWQALLWARSAPKQRKLPCTLQDVWGKGTAAKRPCWVLVPLTPIQLETDPRSFWPAMRRDLAVAFERTSWLAHRARGLSALASAPVSLGSANLGVLAGSLLLASSLPLAAYRRPTLVVTRGGWVKRKSLAGQMNTSISAVVAPTHGYPLGLTSCMPERGVPAVGLHTFAGLFLRTVPTTPGVMGVSTVREPHRTTGTRYLPTPSATDCGAA